MKTKPIIISLSILITLIVGITLLVLNNNNTISKINKTNSIIVNNLSSEDANKTITNTNDINKIIQILKDRKEMDKDQVIPYKGTPHYKLTLLNKKEKEITEISIFYFDKESSYLKFKDDETYYTIDITSLIELIK